MLAASAFDLWSLPQVQTLLLSSSRRRRERELCFGELLFDPLCHAPTSFVSSERSTNARAMRARGRVCRRRPSASPRVRSPEHRRVRVCVEGQRIIDQGSRIFDKRPHEDVSVQFASNLCLALWRHAAGQARPAGTACAVGRTGGRAGGPPPARRVWACVVVERHNFLQENSSSPCAGHFCAGHCIDYNIILRRRNAAHHPRPNSTRCPTPHAGQNPSRSVLDDRTLGWSSWSGSSRCWTTTRLKSLWWRRPLKGDAGVTCDRREAVEGAARRSYCAG